MTPEENHLWYDFLKKLPFTVNRQKIIGDYIVDFFIASKLIAIEIDGRQHGFDNNVKKDRNRDVELESLGIIVLRYTNEEINQKFDIVCRDLLNHLGLTETDLKI